MRPFRPICCLHFGPVSREKQHLISLFGEMKKDMRGTKDAKSAPNFGRLLEGRFYYKIGKMRFLAKMLAADQLI